MDGTEVDFTNWNSGNPNGGDGENYVRMGHSSGTWYENPYSATGDLICKKRAA